MDHTIPTETTKLQREVIRLREIIASHESARTLRLDEEEAAAQPAAPAVDAAKLDDLDDLGKLIAIAEAATQGEWTARVDETATLRDSVDNQLAIYTHLNTRTGGRRNPDEVAANARLAAAANPATILRIAALVAQQAARIAELESKQMQLVGHISVRQGDADGNDPEINLDLTGAQLETLVNMDGAPVFAVVIDTQEGK